MADGIFIREPLSAGSSIIQERVDGNIFTPMLPDSYKRVMLLIDDGDMADFDALDNEGETFVTDLLTDEDFYVRRAPCGLGCHCAAQIVR